SLVTIMRNVTESPGCNPSNSFTALTSNGMVIASMKPGISSCLITTVFSAGLSSCTTPLTWKICRLVLAVAVGDGERGISLVQPRPRTSKAATTTKFKIFQLAITNVLSFQQQPLTSKAPGAS